MPPRHTRPHFRTTASTETRKSPIHGFRLSPDRDAGTVTASPFVAKMAEEMIGRSDPLAAQWLIRITFALWYWPAKDKHTEHELVKRFAAPSVTLGLR